MKRLVVGLLVLAGLLLVADRVGAVLAERVVAERLQTSAGLAARPTVSVGGFPFLTQVVAGRYSQVRVTATDVPTDAEGTIRLTSLDAELSGVRLPLSDLLARRIGALPVDRLEGRALLPYSALAQSSGERRLSVAPAGDRLRVTGSIELLGRDFTAVAVSRVRLEGDEIVVTGESYEVGNAAANQVLTTALAGALDVRVRLGALPYGLQVRDVAVRPDGVLVMASATDAVLQP